MSTKIYEAYRIPVSRVSDFMEEFNEQNTVVISNTIKELINTYCDCEAMKLAKERYPKDDDDIRRNSFVVARALTVCVNVSRKMYKSEYNIDCWVNFFLKGKFAYAIPSMSGHGEFEPKEWMNDFSYWNNSDKPDEVSTRSWNHRENIWHYFLNGNNEDKTKISYQPIEMRNSFGDLEMRNSIGFSVVLLVEALERLKNEYKENEFYKFFYTYNSNMIICLLSTLMREEDRETKNRRFIGLDALRLIKESIDITEDEWIEYWVNSDLEMTTKEKTEFCINNWKGYKSNPLDWIMKNDTEYGYFYKVFKKRIESETTRKINKGLL